MCVCVCVCVCILIYGKYVYIYDDGIIAISLGKCKYRILDDCIYILNQFVV